jgi:hypothetical protein
LDSRLRAAVTQAIELKRDRHALSIRRLLKTSVGAASHPCETRSDGALLKDEVFYSHTYLTLRRPPRSALCAARGQAPGRLEGCQQRKTACFRSLLTNN